MASSTVMNPPACLARPLEDDGVNVSSYIRAMPCADFTLTEFTSNAGLFLREALEFDMVTAKQLKTMGVPADLLAYFRQVTGK